MDKPLCFTTKSVEFQRNRSSFSLKSLRLSLKYRPDILKLVLKMRQTIRTKNALLKKLERQFKNLASKNSQCTQTDLDPPQKKDNIDSLGQGNRDAIPSDKSNSFAQTSVEETEDFKLIDKNEKVTEDSYTQTENLDSIKENKTSNNDSNEVSSTAWDIQSDGDKTKSIADQVKEVAQNALQQTGMVYVETAGMYYDYKTGYYYNSELGLYYHTDTGCYYYYSDEKQTFVFHSYPYKSAMNESTKPQQVKKAAKKKKDNEDGETKPKRRKTKNAKKKQENPIDKVEKDEEMQIDNEEEVVDTSVAVKEVEIDLSRELEDGECSDTASEESDGEVSDASTSTASDDEVAKHHPPCMRIIVRETGLAKLKVGSLYLITKDGGTIGREGDHHAIVLRDHNVSRNHLDLKYDVEERAYYAVDLGSKNGTLLNGSRMSESQQTSDPMQVVHGSTIQLGETKLLCHIHAGNDTCGHCEPGLLMETQEKEKKVAYTRTCSVQKQHQLELARLKNKYAPKRLEIEETAYNDRAQARRETVGSSHHSEKTQSSDINTFITPENKGFKLLEKMGWSKGEGLGKDNQGEREPIPIVSNEGTTGLGSTSEPKRVVSKTLGPATLRLAAKTKMLQPPAKVSQQEEEEEDDTTFTRSRGSVSGSIGPLQSDTTIPIVSNEGTTGLGSTSEPKRVVSKTLGAVTLRLAAKTKMLQPPAKVSQQEEEDSDDTTFTLSKGSVSGSSGPGISQSDTTIPLVSNEGTTGLGSTIKPKRVDTTLGPATLRLAAKTKMLQPPAKVFQQEEEDSDET
ncbi:angiogenic factor with G patch and FHA domains 1 isoform X2 [Maniola hyperantus]|uniref:angiogenic factor with G patch and FHA domains 1 isoform X2 n=1 Tax=Aphantopus hyperantus TaxID=2795564 RepID=UPI0037493C7D